MADYGVGITGLPADVTEEELLAYVELYAPAGSTVGVSIAYDYHDHKDLIDCLLDMHVQQQDVRLGLLDESQLEHSSHAKALGAEDPDQVREVLESLECSGTAWVVFHTEADRELFRGKLSVSRSRFRGEFELGYYDTAVTRYGRYDTAEPVTFFWHDFMRPEKVALMLR